jgi:hypothetical protein
VMPRHCFVSMRARGVIIEPPIPIEDIAHKVLTQTFDSLAKIPSNFLNGYGYCIR